MENKLRVAGRVLGRGDGLNAWWALRRALVGTSTRCGM